MAQPDQVFISDLPDAVNDEMLHSVLGPYGAIKWCKTIPPQAGKTAAALVQFESSADAKWLQENLNGNIPEGLEGAIKVEFPKTQVFISGLPDAVNDEMLHSVFGAYGAIKWCKPIPPKAALVQFESSEEAQWFQENLNGNIPEGLEAAIKVEFSKTQNSTGGGKDKGKGKGKLKDNSFGKAGGKGGKDVAFVAPAGPYDGSNGKGKGGKGKGGDGGGKGGIKGLLQSAAVKGGYAPDDPKPDENCVYVKGLPSDTTDRDLYELFAPFGAIPPRGVLAMQKDGVCTGVGFVDFVDQLCTLNAIQCLNGLPTSEGDALFLKQKNPRSGKGKGDDKGKGKVKGKW